MVLLAMMAGLAVGRPVLAQIVIGDDHPPVMVDQSVLDRLGPEASLPDLLLGRQAPAAAPGYNRKAGQTLPAPLGPVSLHKPVHRTAVKQIHKARRMPTVTPAVARTVTPAVAKPAAAVPVVEARNDSGKPEVEKTKPAEPAASPTPPVVASAPPETAVPKIDLPPAPAQPPAKVEAAPAPPPKAETPPPAKAETPPPPPAPALLTPPAPLPVVAAPAVPPPPPIIATQAPQEAGQQITRLPPSATGSSAADGAPAILFEKDQARLPEDARTALTRLAGRMAAEPTVEVQLLAYAEGDDSNASKARRLSLSRALAVRSFLIDQGVRSTRIEVRALGNKVSDGPADRVDLVIQKH